MVGGKRNPKISTVQRLAKAVDVTASAGLRE
jgi:hypothetical protein